MTRILKFGGVALAVALCFAGQIFATDGYFSDFHAFERTVSGVNSIPPTAGGGNANVRTYEDSVSLGFGWSRE